MASTSRTTLRRRLGGPIVGAVMATWLAAAAAGAATPPPGFLLERGRFRPVTVPPGVEDPSALGIGPIDLNDRGQIVGVAGTPDPAPMGRMA